MIPKVISFILSKKYYLIIIILLALGGVYYYSKSNNTDGLFVHLTKGALINEVSVAGKVVSSKDVDLSFETGGTVDTVNKTVGQRVGQGEVIAALDSSELRANLAKAEADLAAEQSKLDQLQNVGASTEVTTAKRKLVDSILDGYTAADDGIRNKVDQFFEDADTMNPKILFAFNDYDLKEKINNNRIIIEETLMKWKALDENLSETTVTDTTASTARGYLSKVKSFLDDVSRAVNNFETNNTLSQTTIDKYKSDVALARTNINNALGALTTAEEGIRSTSSDKPVQESRVKSAIANVDAIKVQVEKAYIRAPFSGIISKQDAKVGEAVSAHTNLVSLISETYEIEAYIPELNISGVDVGDKASVTLDAFPQNQKWSVTVIQIDPAETVKDGVATYKVRFAFDNSDVRIKSGMTANLIIETGRRDGVNYLPSRAVISRDGKYFVQVTTTDDKAEREITVGEKDSKGNIEVLSGITASDNVYLSPVK